jgi:putative flippase GtrA
MINKQTLHFLIIGALASLSNFILVFIFVHLNLAEPLVANFFAYLISFNVSYLGHRYLTFSETTQSHKKAASQFFVNCLIGLSLTQVIYYVLLHIFYIQYLVALFITMLLVAIYTFFVSKYLIFKA